MTVWENVDELPRGEASFREAENSGSEVSADNLDTLSHQALETSTREIDDLIGELEILRERAASRISFSYRRGEDTGKASPVIGYD